MFVLLLMTPFSVMSKWKVMGMFSPPSVLEEYS